MSRFKPRMAPTSVAPAPGRAAAPEATASARPAAAPRPAAGTAGPAPAAARPAAAAPPARESPARAAEGEGQDERENPGGDRRDHRADQRHGDEARCAASRGRTEKSPEDRGEDAPHDHHNHEQHD